MPHCIIKIISILIRNSKTCFYNKAINGGEPIISVTLTQDTCQVSNRKIENTKIHGRMSTCVCVCNWSSIYRSNMLSWTVLVYLSWHWKSHQNIL